MCIIKPFEAKTYKDADIVICYAQAAQEYKEIKSARNNMLTRQYFNSVFFSNNQKVVTKSLSYA